MYGFFFGAPVDIPVGLTYKNCSVVGETLNYIIPLKF